MYEGSPSVDHTGRHLKFNMPSQFITSPQSDSQSRFQKDNPTPW